MLDCFGCRAQGLCSGAIMPSGQVLRSRLFNLKREAWGTVRAGVLAAWHRCEEQHPTLQAYMLGRDVPRCMMCPPSIADLLLHGRVDHFFVPASFSLALGHKMMAPAHSVNDADGALGGLDAPALCNLFHIPLSSTASAALIPKVSISLKPYAQIAFR